jgi:8-oxo-dGTP pyrophosphatase MutT (NUDIX family)
MQLLVIPAMFVLDYDRRTRIYNMHSAFCNLKSKICNLESVATLDLMVYNLQVMLERIRKNLATDQQQTSAPAHLTPAAVLLPLLLKDDELHILFTKRTQTVKAHKGQVSFPGGVRDPDDESLLTTALREAQEEIGLGPEDVEILGPLDPITTVTTGFLVYTFVGLIPYPYPFQLNGREVAEIIVVPFDFLADDAHWSWRSYLAHDQPFQAYFVTYGNYRIWGATARILKIFFEKNSIEMNIKSVMES